MLKADLFELFSYIDSDSNKPGDIHATSLPLQTIPSYPSEYKKASQIFLKCISRAEQKMQKYVKKNSCHVIYIHLLGRKNYVYCVYP
jgi:hypothetical protein